MISNNGFIFYCEGISEELFKNLNKYLKQELVEIKCSFTFNNKRHIDELMCFMPYNNDFKVWIYDFGEIKYNSTEDIDKFFEIIYTEEEKFNYLEIVKIKMEDIKEILNTEFNINFINNPNPLSDIENILNKIGFNPQYTNLRLLLKNIYSLISFLNKDFHPYNSIEILLNKLKFDNFSELDKLKFKKIFTHDISSKIKETNLKQERINNLNLISNKLFGSNYESNQDKFVFFPIDIEFNLNYDSYTCDILYPPIFNRIIIKNEDKNHIFFPLDDSKDEKIIKYNEIIKTIIDKEFTGFPNNIYYMINTRDYHKKIGSAGGNLHCLIKQIY